MNKYTFCRNGFTFYRINRAKAENAYNNGLAVILCPCNLRPDGPFYPACAIDPRTDGPFSAAVNRFTWYNCINTETGRYLAFYIPVKAIDWYTGKPLPSGTNSDHFAYDHSYMREIRT